MTGAGHPWFLYPLGGWGLGLIHHAVGYRRTRQIYRDLEGFMEMSDADLRLFRRYQALVSGLLHHGATTYSVSAYLAAIWAINGGGYPWWLIPAAALGISYGLHRISTRGRLSALDKALADLSAGNSPRGKSSGAGELDSRELKEARVLEKELRESLGRLAPVLPDYSKRAEPLLKGLMESATLLDRRRNEIDRVLQADSANRIDEERRELEERSEAARSPQLREEYGRTLKLLHSQEETLVALSEQRDLAEAKLHGALNSLRHLHLDIMRMSGVSQPGEGSRSLDDLSRQAEELRSYVVDFDRELRRLEEL